MFDAHDGYLGCSEDLRSIIDAHGHLNSKVIERVNGSQELIMLNAFTRQANEACLKKSLEHRISEIESWQWVLKDLSSRLEDSISQLKYEQNALNVVLDRIKDEIEVVSEEGSKPGALCPYTDVVEDAIMVEYNYLRTQKKNFQKTLAELEKQINVVEKTKRNIDNNLLNKQMAIEVDQKCFDEYSQEQGDFVKKKKKKSSPIEKWEKQCSSYKTAGLNALVKALFVRVKVRGARIQLSIEAHAHSSKVDAALKRRYHANQVKLDELYWQKDEALKDLETLKEELELTNKTLTQNNQQVTITESKLVNRTQRPSGEHTIDGVHVNLKSELARLKSFIKNLKDNQEDIKSLQKSIKQSVMTTDDLIVDLQRVIKLDYERLKSRGHFDQDPKEKKEVLETIREEIEEYDSDE